MGEKDYQQFFLVKKFIEKKYKSKSLSYAKQLEILIWLLYLQEIAY